MRKAFGIALVALLASAATVHASTTAIRASPTGAIVGQQVTFTASLTSSCAGAIATHYFTVDGKQAAGKYVQTGQSATETLSITTLGVGAHAITYTWKQTGTICRGAATLTYTVSPLPSPTPAPSPSPSPSPSASPSPAHLTSPTSSGGSDTMLGYLGGGLIVVVVIAGVALAVLGRR